MIKAPPFCTSYEEAREIFLQGELQAWDGCRWEDIPAGCTPFFSRRVEEYRRRPKTGPEKKGPAFLVTGLTPKGTRVIHPAYSAKYVTMDMWESSLTSIEVFKRVELTDPLNLTKVERELEKA